MRELISLDFQGFSAADFPFKFLLRPTAAADDDSACLYE